MGAYAEYVCMSKDGPVAIKPSNLSYEQAAALSFGGSTMLDFYRRSLSEAASVCSSMVLQVPSVLQQSNWPNI